jgi:hypothetical protein
MGWVLVIAGATGLLLGWALAICLGLAGYFLSRCKGYRFCFVIACITCLWPPLGTALGVCTILVLSRENVKDLFAGKLTLAHDPEDGDTKQNSDPVPSEPILDALPGDDRFTSRMDPSTGRHPT